MIFFTSDLHFGHSNIIKYCKRPFVDTKEMDEQIIKKWNKKVAKGDGCILINIKLERANGGLPKGCWHCKYLEMCRRAKEDAWKCYDGCIVIKKRKKREK